LKAKPPLLYLVAPGFRFHPAIDIVLRYLSPEIEVVRVALAENWRRSLRWYSGNEALKKEKQPWQSQRCFPGVSLKWFV